MAQVVSGYPGPMVATRRGRTTGIGTILLVVWLVIGVVAAAQRGYFSGEDTSCASVSTIVVTIIAGPLNYLGVNPKVDCPSLPEPSE
jgi:hypothetical protein